MRHVHADDCFRIQYSGSIFYKVKSGGHGTNPGFSSTTGVHISLKKFTEIKYDAQKNVATVGAGLIWDDVYAALDPLGVGVVGGRASGVRNHLITFDRLQCNRFGFSDWCCWVSSWWR